MQDLTGGFFGLVECNPCRPVDHRVGAAHHGKEAARTADGFAHSRRSRFKRAVCIVIAQGLELGLDNSANLLRVLARQCCSAGTNKARRAPRQARTASRDD